MQATFDNTNAATTVYHMVHLPLIFSSRVREYSSAVSSFHLIDIPSTTACDTKHLHINTHMNTDKLCVILFSPSIAK